MMELSQLSSELKNFKPEVGLILGSGLGFFADEYIDIKGYLPYGDIEGSERLRSAIASLYERQQVHNTIVTHGTIGANMLVHKTLIAPGDQVVAVVPTYQQHYSIPASLGADVRRLKLREEDGFLPDLDELRKLVTPDTLLIAINNPKDCSFLPLSDQLLP